MEARTGTAALGGSGQIRERKLTQDLVQHGGKRNKSLGGKKYLTRLHSLLYYLPLLAFLLLIVLSLLLFSYKCPYPT